MDLMDPRLLDQPKLLAAACKLTRGSVGQAAGDTAAVGRRATLNHLQEDQGAPRAATMTAVMDHGHNELPDDVDVHDDDARQKEFIKQRNALYSKRKYIRKKIEIEVLERQSQAVTATNHMLKQEQERLERLVQQAQECIVRNEVAERMTSSPPPTTS
jgi:hypothetical protein